MLLGALVTVALTCLIVGITMLVYMIAFTHGDPAINLDEYKANQNQTTIVYAYDKNQQPVEVTRLHGTEKPHLGQPQPNAGRNETIGYRH